MGGCFGSGKFGRPYIKIARIFLVTSPKHLKATAKLLNLPSLRKYHEAALKQREKLDKLLSSELPKYTTEDTSLMVFGSLARGEWTSKSDLDWTYLIDGVANSDHQRISQQIRFLLKKKKIIGPGATGTFGDMAFSHDIVHQIGGQNDTNRNTTQRILLLLESCCIGKTEIGRIGAHERVLRAVISRYIEEDDHPLTPDSKRYRVPRFWVNDVVRFWRTMAVDFASKQRDRGGEGWGLRNAKLRMSRKLIFASGLLVCFGANLDYELNRRISTDKNVIKLNLAKYIRDQVSSTPLQILANAIDQYAVPQPIAKELFGAYAEFLKILDDRKLRKALENVRSADSRTDPTFKRIRKISEAFEHALDNIFFENKQIAPLTRKYGVF